MLRLTLLVLVTAATMVAAPAAFASPPANDFFASAQAISSLPFSDSGDLSGTSTEAGEPQVCNFQAQSVWYSFTPSVTTAVRVDLNGSDFGVVANVYQSFGSGIGSLGFAGCIGFGGSTQLTVPAGATYYIQAGSVSFGSAHLQLNVTAIAPPVNDDFANAAAITSLPFSDTTDRTAAGIENGEPVSTSCGPISHTIWYAYTPSADAIVYAHGNATGVNSFIAVYTGSSLADLSQLSCGSERNIFDATAGTTYYLQVGSYDGQGGAPQSFSLEVAPDPSVAAFASPSDPSTFDAVQFSAFVFDPAAFGTVQSEHWDFGDGTSSDGCCPTHRYGADGSYTAKVAVTMTDGRIGTAPVTLDVKTHDVAIDRMTAPQTASPGQTKTIAVSIATTRYPETVQVVLSKSVAGGFADVGSLTATVPVGKATDLKFSYGFTAADAVVGKVSFRATATIVGARDALPADNSFTAFPTRVR